MKPTNCYTYLIFNILILLFSPNLKSQNHILLQPERVFDGEKMQTNYVVLIQGKYITAVGPADEISTPGDAKIIQLPNTTLLPGQLQKAQNLLGHSFRS